MLHDPTGPVGRGESRAQVLGILRASAGAVGVREIADRTGLHANTARFHLNTLVKDGLAERGSEGHDGPGRPRTVYRATRPAQAAAAGRRSYQLLAQMLTGLITQAVPHPERAAIDAGEAWGRYLAESPPPDQRVDAAEAVRRLVDVLTDVGFAPDPGPDATAPVIPLRHCPFREVAQDHRDVVCSLHLGLMRGTLKEVHAPLEVESLEPFVEPSLCLAHIVPAAAAG